MYKVNVKKLRRLMIEHRLYTNEEFSQAAGVSGATVRRILKGDPVRIVTIKKIAAFFNIDVNDLLLED